MEVIDFRNIYDLMWSQTIPNGIDWSFFARIRYHQHSGFRIETIKGAMKE